MYTGNIIGRANELSCEQVDRLVETRANLGISAGGRPQCRYAAPGRPSPCSDGPCPEACENAEVVSIVRSIVDQIRSK